MQYQELLQYAGRIGNPVILLEGTRDLPAEDKPRLVNFARQLAIQLPTAIFRTGNASGSDEAFAEGVASKFPERLEYVLPHASMRQKNRLSNVRHISLEQIDEDLEGKVIAETVKASSKYRGLLNLREINPKLRIKSNYLLRDTLKVLGCESNGFAPASVGIFYANREDPEKGGTGHTIRVCRDAGIPIIMQQAWLTWFSENQ